MKRLLLSLVAIAITSVCFGQDVIVKKDGSTIQAKVLKVTQSEVEYKNFNNQNGPTYTITTKDLQCINYENGSTDKFVSENYNPNIVTNETATQYSNDKQLLEIYNNQNKKLLTENQKKARKLRTIGWITGGVLVAAGTTMCSLAGNFDHAYTICIPGSVVIAGGIAAWAGCYFSAKKIEKSQYSVQSSPLYRQEFKVGKSDHLMVGVDLLKDNTFKHQTLGLGFTYNF